MERLDTRRPTPRRRGAGPLIVLGLFALVPALVLLRRLRVGRRPRRRQRGGAAAADDDRRSAAARRAVAQRDAQLPSSPAPSVSRDLNVDEFDAVVADFGPSLNDRSCAAVVVDGADVGERNADLAVIPASNQKILVAAVALDVLGDDFRYTTEVVTERSPSAVSSPVTSYLVGGGDPLLSSDWYPTSNLDRRPVFNTDVARRARRCRRGGRRHRGRRVRCSATAAATTTSSSPRVGATGWPVSRPGRTTRCWSTTPGCSARTSAADDPNEAAAREFARLLRDQWHRGRRRGRRRGHRRRRRVPGRVDRVGTADRP